MPATPANIGTSVLRTLHRIHRQLSDLKERLDRGPKQIRAAEANVLHRDELLSNTKAKAKAMRMAADQKQLQLKSGEDKVKDLRRKLNAATSNREYQALLEQIAADEMTNSVLADEILEALEKVDEFKANITEAETGATAAKQKAEQVHAEVAAREPVLKAEIGRLETELKGFEATLPDDIRQLYQRVVKHKGEDAPGVSRKSVLRRLQSTNSVEHAQPDHARPTGVLQDLRKVAVSAGVGSPVGPSPHVSSASCIASATSRRLARK